MANNLHSGKIYTCENFLNVFVVILDHENIGLDNIFVPLSFIVAKILKKIGFSVMAAINLHTDKINTCDNFSYAFIAIIDHENVGLDSIFVTLSCIVAKILKKIGFLVMVALICIFKKLPKVGPRTTKLNCFRNPVG